MAQLFQSVAGLPTLGPGLIQFYGRFVRPELAADVFQAAGEPTVIESFVGLHHLLRQRPLLLLRDHCPVQICQTFLESAAFVFGNAALTGILLTGVGQTCCNAVQLGLKGL
jgi:hypothetical protein